MLNDPVVEEIRRHRQAHAAQYNNDLHKICEALREEEKMSAFKVVYPNPRPFLQSLSSKESTHFIISGNDGH